MAFTSSRVCFAAIVLGCLALGCDHVQAPGQYAFTAEEIIRDDCELLADADALWDGRLHISGEVVWMDYALYDMELRGQYKYNLEAFVMDGSAANVTEVIAGEECRFDFVTVQLEGESQSESTFTGTVRANYQPSPGSLCECSVWARFRATRS